MTVLDDIIIALFASSAIAGLFSGFLRGVCSLVTWILALWGGWHYGHLIEPYLGGDLADPPFSTWAGSTLVFLTVLFVGAAISAILGYLVRLSLFRGMDRFLGLLFGMARGVVIVGVLAIVCQTVRLDGQPWWRHARLIPLVQQVSHGLRLMAGERLPRSSFPVGF